MSAAVTDERTTGTVLVVDDDDGVRTVLGKWVSALGHEVHTAPDADAALAMLGETSIDVAVCDMRMPGHDGAWLVDQMRHHHPRVAIIIATGLLELEPSVTLGPGVVGYLVKPFKRDQLAGLLEQALETAAELQARPARAALDLDALDGDIVEGTVISRE